MLYFQSEQQQLNALQLWTPDWGSLMGLLPEFQDKAPAKSLHDLSCDRQQCILAGGSRSGRAGHLAGAGFAL